MKATTFYALVALASAEIQHTSLTKNLQVPAGSFSHFMLVGTGIDDQNIDADITSVGYDLRIQTTDPSQTFDLYLFSGNNSADYDCYVMGAQLWADYGKL